MKKNKILYLLTFIVLIATGCSQKFLEDMGSFDKFDESIFTNETQTGWYIDRIYYDFFSGFRSPIQTLVGAYSDEKTRMTEEIGGTVGNFINPQKTLVNASDGNDYYGAPLSTKVVNNPYSRIRNCNFLIGKMDAVGGALSDQFRERAKGQAYFFRALQYFDLVRTYGGVPIVTTVDPASTTDESIKLPRATPAECVAQIIEDLDSAANMLPARWEVEKTAYGRFTSAAALAMKSRVLLTFASPLFNANWDNTGDARWQDALTASLAAETALTAAGYGLYGSNAKDWSEMWFKNDNSFNKEAIMVQLFSKETAASGITSNGWERSIRLTDQTGSGGISAPKEMIDLFPMADGSRPVNGDNYDDELFFMNRDPRFYRTFAFSGSKWGTKEDGNDVVWMYRWRFNGNKVAYSDGNSVISPAVVRKMSNPAASTENGLAFSGTDIFEYRYAELLLNIAECYAAKGDIGNCVVYLGKIRNRVGIDPANNYGIGTPADKYAAIEACLYERRVELAYEGKRFWDIQRWMLYNDDPAAGNNTCAKLRIDPINGTARTGNYWQYKDMAPSNADPLIAERAGISIDPDAPDFATQLNNLKTFYENNIVLTPLDQPMDKDGSAQPLFINWRQNYYISGLKSNILSSNEWLEQTIGWNDYNGVPGTFEYR